MLVEVVSGMVLVVAVLDTASAIALLVVLVLDQSATVPNKASHQSFCTVHITPKDRKSVV